MLKGEISQITVKPEYGFGTDLVESAGTNVSAHSTLVYEVELVDFTKVMTKLSRQWIAGSVLSYFLSLIFHFSL